MVPINNRLTSFPINNMILFWITIISIIVQASLLPIDEDTDKRTGHNIMRFGRQAGHNILRFGRTPGHNIMRFGKREESNSAPGSSYEISESKSPSSSSSSASPSSSSLLSSNLMVDYPGAVDHFIIDQLPPSSLLSSSSSASSPSSSSLTSYLNNVNTNLNNLNNAAAYDINASSLPFFGYFGQPSSLNALYYNQRGQPVLPYQQAKKGRPETDHVIMRFG